MDIVVAGPRPSVRQGLLLLLGSVDGWSAREAPDVADAGGRATLAHADVLVFDLDPFAERLPLLRRIVMTGTRIVAVMTTASEPHVRAALDAGAAACVGKQQVAERLPDAIRDVAAAIS